MGLELGQIITHIIGFVIAVIILKKFAWKPLLSILEERRSKIKGEFDSIKEERKKTEKLYSDYQTKLKEIDSLARAKIQEAAREGRKLANEIKESARGEAKQIVTRTREEIQRDLDKAKIQLRDDVVNMTLHLAERIIQEKLDKEKDRRLIAQFVDEMKKGKVEGFK
ncbi:MAG: F0F1 ATP synthase subunit B [candidate division Zixibacteria bacterium]|nr:F0F1 ATP synthase subunit B [candidate division Zixibacteria bacterium]